MLWGSLPLAPPAVRMELDVRALKSETNLPPRLVAPLRPQGRDEGTWASFFGADYGAIKSIPPRCGR